MIAELSHRVRSHPVASGAVVGLTVGLAGLLGPSGDAYSYAGATLGAVAGGATAALLTDQGLQVDVRNAVLADFVSSALFFAGVVGWMAVEDTAASEGAFGAVWRGVLFGLVGSVVAIPVALVSLCVAALAGAAASVAVRRRRGDAVAAESRRK